MESYNYKVIGYAESDLIAEGIPFAVVIYFPSHRHVHAYVRSDWQLGIGEVVANDRSMIEGFLEDLKHCSEFRGTAASVFFNCLESLDVGPVRTVVSGQCAEDAIPILTNPDRPINRLLGDSFTQLLDCLKAAQP